MSIKIFISHASADEPLASALIDCIFSSMVLDDNEVRCTSVPGYRLPIGSEFAQTIRDELNESAVVIGLITQNAIKSGWVLFELGATWGANKKIKPIVSNEVNIGALPGPLSQRHVAQLANKGDIIQFLDELATLIAAKSRSPVKSNQAIDTLIKAHEEHLKAIAEQKMLNTPLVKESLIVKDFGLNRETLRSFITLGWQLARYEFAYGSDFPEAKAVVSDIVAQIERLLAHDSFPENVVGRSFHELMDSVASYYSTISSGKYAAIMFGIAAMRTSLVGASKDDQNNREMERVAYSALADVDPMLLPNKEKLFQALLQYKPRAIVDVMQLLDRLSNATL